MLLSRSAQLGALVLAVSVSAWGLPGVQAISYTAVDLHPTGVTNSLATGIDGGVIAGAAGPIGLAPYPNYPFMFASAYQWTDTTSSSAANINPSGQTYSRINGVSAGQLIGTGQYLGAFHALLWTTPTTTVDLNGEFETSFGIGIAGNQQVGLANGTATDFSDHAILWSGSALNPVDLHVASITPPGGEPIIFTESIAYGTSGAKQVGNQTFTDIDFFTNSHAFLWSGSASSFVDLNGDLFGSSAYGIDGDDQVGMGYVSEDGNKHALLWNNTAASVIDLTPATMDVAEAWAVRDGTQVGYGSFFGEEGLISHAMAWQGSAESAVDLHAYLPAGYTDSQAFAIDSDGTIVGFARTETGQMHAVAWIATVPEPATAGLLLLGVSLLLRRRR